MKWDFWVGNDDNEPVLFVKNLVHIMGRRIDLHKIVKADKLGCYHTHPANAIRIPLIGGYEELVHALSGRNGHCEYRTWRWGRIGLVRPLFCHRIHRVLNGKPCYTLWIRGKVTHDIELIGWGWSDAQKARVAPTEGHSVSA